MRFIVFELLSFLYFTIVNSDLGLGTSLYIHTCAFSVQSIDILLLDTVYRYVIVRFLKFKIIIIHIWRGNEQRTCLYIYIYNYIYIYVYMPEKIFLAQVGPKFFIV